MRKILVLILLLTVISIPGKASAECVDLSVNLRQGIKDVGANKHVYQLQSLLKEKGYLAVNPTGYFGALTTRAVKNLQKDNAISQTGTVGPLTRALIKKVSCVSAVPETPVVNTDNSSSNSNTNTTQNPSTPVVIVDPAPVVNPPAVEDVILTAPNNSSLKVRTDGVVSLGSNTVTVRGTITAGARSATERWFELTKNPDLYKLSESTQSPRKSQRTNDNFQETFSDLTPATMYYFRVCAENKDLGQKSCGGTVSFKTNNQ